MVEGKQHLIGFLNKLRAAFIKPNAFALRELGNKAIAQAALQNSRDTASIALLAYCLHKLCSKQHIVRHRKWPAIKKQIASSLMKAINALQRGDQKRFDKSLKAVIDSVQLTDRQLGNYVQGLLEKAKVKYASSAYSLGLGLSQSAALTGADKKDLLHYIGSTKIADREAITFGIKERLQKLRKGLATG